jgi:hypothetical protein
MTAALLRKPEPIASDAMLATLGSRLRTSTNVVANSGKSPYARPLAVQGHPWRPVRHVT